MQTASSQLGFWPWSPEALLRQRAALFISSLPAYARRLNRLDRIHTQLADWQNQTGRTLPPINNRTFEDFAQGIRDIYGLFLRVNAQVITAAQTAQNQGRIKETDWSTRRSDDPGLQAVIAVFLLPIISLAIAILLLGIGGAIGLGATPMIAAKGEADARLKAEEAYATAQLEFVRQTSQLPPRPGAGETSTTQSMATAATGIGVAGFAALALVALVMLKGRRR